MPERLEEKLKEYFTGKNEVIAVYLFGSCVEGKYHPLSDIDMGILFDDTSTRHMKERRNRYMKELSRILRNDVHPAILNTANEVLMKQIFSKGKCVIVNNPKKLSNFKMVATVKIADFAFYHSQMQAGLIRRFMEE